MRHDEEMLRDALQPGDEREQGEDEQGNNHHER